MSASALNSLSSMNEMCIRKVNRRRCKKFKERPVIIIKKITSKELESVLGRMLNNSLRSLTEVKWVDPKSVNCSNRRPRVLNNVLHKNQSTLTSLDISSAFLMDINAITWGMQHLQQLKSLQLKFHRRVHFENNDFSKILTTIQEMIRLENLSLKFSSEMNPYSLGVVE